MKNDTSSLIRYIRYFAIAGNVLFALWIMYNGMSVGFQGTRVEIFSFMSLIGLLVINTILLLRSAQNRQN